MFEFLKTPIPLRAARGSGALMAALLLCSSVAAHTVNESVLPYQGRSSHPDNAKDGTIPRAEAPPPSDVDARTDDPDTHEAWFFSPARVARFPVYARLLSLW